MKGARIGLLITRGFRAIQEVQNQARESYQFDLRFRRPLALGPRSLTREITGRLDFRSIELEPLDEAEVADAVDDLVERGVTSYAVRHLFSFANQYEIFGSAYGASPTGDGASGASVHLANLFIAPVEIIESEFPCRITRFELNPDSGGGYGDPARRDRNRLETDIEEGYVSRESARRDHGADET